MKIFFDTEFTNLHKQCQLISIGMIKESGEGLYIELNDFNLDNCTEFVKRNVLPNTNNFSKSPFKIIENSNSYFCNKNDAAEIIRNWIYEPDVQLVSDVCHYDFLLFIDLFGTAFDLPKNISPICEDITYLIADKNDIMLKDAFDVSREGLIPKEKLDTIYSKAVKHNALYDALIIKLIYEELK